MPPSNAYLTADGLSAPEPVYPLRLKLCTECWLLQTEDYVPREHLFGADYAYFSSVSRTWLEHSERFVKHVTERFGLDAHSMVAEVASNDGYLLQFLQRDGIPCYGIEPTLSTATAARKLGLSVVTEFFGESVAHELVSKNRGADLLIANNVLAHVPDLNDFIAGMKVLLRPQGVITVEVPHVQSLVSKNQFDSVYHEHFSYWSLMAAEHAFERQGLHIFDVDVLPTHGGSLRLYIQHEDASRHADSARLSSLKVSEQAAGLHTVSAYRGLQDCAENTRRALLDFLKTAQAANKTVGGYGAAAKGNTLLNFGNIGPDLIPWVVDANPAKQGKYLPGSHIPICDESRIKQAQPDYILILPWNIKQEIMAQLSYAQEWDATFVTAIPALEFCPASRAHSLIDG